MRNPVKGMVTTGLFLGLIFGTAYAKSHNTVDIKEETAQYILDIHYPQGFQAEPVNSTLKSFIADTQKSFLNELSEDKNVPADAPGKTGLNVTYSVPYESATALSVRFNISIYHRGAAHPSNTVVVQNFVKGQKVALADLFVSGSDYLKPIADFCNKAITAKNISDENWIKEGTKPTAENYSIWAFTDKGIDIIFNSYQVAAYVYGEQTVSIPLSVISAHLKPELVKAVWGN